MSSKAVKSISTGVKNLSVAKNPSAPKKQVAHHEAPRKKSAEAGKKSDPVIKKTDATKKSTGPKKALLDTKKPEHGRSKSPQPKHPKQKEHTNKAHHHKEEHKEEEKKVHQHKPNPDMLMSKYLTPEVKAALVNAQSSSGAKLADIIRSGTENPDSSCGLYASDMDSYEVFAPLFDPIIQAYHGLPPTEDHKARDLDAKNLGSLADLDPNNNRILSSRVRTARNLAKYPLTPGIQKQQRLDLETEVKNILLANLTEDLSGEYVSLASMDKPTKEKLIAEHMLFQEGDRFMASANINGNWPEGRGVFFSKDRRLLVWINEEDHMRVIAMQKGGNLAESFAHLSRALSELEKSLKFAWTKHLGFITACPTNLGTTMRASVHIKLPLLSALPENHKMFDGAKNFKDLCKNLKLSVRGTDGETFSKEDNGGVFDISNKARLGFSETELVKLLYKGLELLIAKEKQLEDAVVQKAASEPEKKAAR